MKFVYGLRTSLFCNYTYVCYYLIIQKIERKLVSLGELKSQSYNIHIDQFDLANLSLNLTSQFI